MNSAGALGMFWLNPSLGFVKKEPLLSFSTLGCPKWDFNTVVDVAKKNGYQGIEVRGVMGELDLSKCSVFSTKENIAATKKLMKDNKLKFSDLGSSAAMHLPEGVERQKNLDDAKRFIDLAAELECPNIRVFPNNLPKDQDRDATLALISKGLLTLGDYAKGTHVNVLLESHGELVYVADLKKVMEMAAHPNTGLVWDIHNMWSVTKEAPAAVYPVLKKYIKHTHIKDATISADGKIHYVLMGKGESPIFDGVDILYKDGYAGYYSFEWEKLWHPEIEEPEVAIVDFPKTMREHFSKIA